MSEGELYKKGAVITVYRDSHGKAWMEPCDIAKLAPNLEEDSFKGVRVIPNEVLDEAKKDFPKPYDIPQRNWNTDMEKIFKWKKKWFGSAEK